ncbi:hypothetical protein P8452_07738 [Trifolium repens]|nr:hypothetical protein P8452_07738 [Trifolium repens]
MDVAVGDGGVMVVVPPVAGSVRWSNLGVVVFRRDLVVVFVQWTLVEAPGVDLGVVLEAGAWWRRQVCCVLCGLALVSVVVGVVLGGASGWR